MQLDELPKIAGEYKFDVQLKKYTFFKVGGNCDVMFIPSSVSDLEEFLKNKSRDLPITILGNMSNVLISDFGIRGCVVRLNSIKNIDFYDGYVEVQAGMLLSDFIIKCAQYNVSSCEKLFCIPGTIGGAVYMNAGIPGFEISDVILSIDCINYLGIKKTFFKNDLNMTYRNGNIPENCIVTSVKLKTYNRRANDILEEIETIKTKRLSSQPIGQPTCGSTFKNPEGEKAWELIKRAGCDRLFVGGAKVSEKHCNFLINSGTAKALDFIKLIDLIKTRVYEKTGIVLQEEIKIIGDKW